MKYNPQLVGFPTEDGLNLPGLLFEPQKKSKKAVIYLHGNGSSSVFYDEDEVNSLAQELNKKDVAFFPFNNRGAHYMKTFRVTNSAEESRQTYGTSYELIRDCIQDIDGAVAFVQSQGYEELYLMGISTGANKICVYDY